MIFDISNVNMEKRTSFCNKNKLAEFEKKQYFILQIVPTLEDFKKLDRGIQEELCRTIISDFYREVRDEIIRLLKITPQYITNSYFLRLAEISSVYSILLNIASN